MDFENDSWSETEDGTTLEDHAAPLGNVIIEGLEV